ncbi:MAG: lamin tail domain-containing protein [bacterium]|nr:lamin tail domain-containing protein [bacterium]
MNDLSRGGTFFILLIWTITAGLLPANFISAEEKIDINAAPLEELVKIIHIGEARALELTSLRPFSSLDDLAGIKGIGPSRIEDIKNQGLAWVGPPQTETEATSTEELIEVEPSIITYPAGVVINEILPSPIGPDSEEEWIEIFNQNNFEVNLSGWRIKDLLGKTNIYAFPESATISPRKFLVLSRPTAKITLNNDADGLQLIQPDDMVTDEINYEKAPRGESFNRTESGWVWSAILTQGSANIIPVSKEEPQLKEKESKPADIGRPQAIAAVGGQLPQSSNPKLVISLALALAIFSGTIILILKSKIRPKEL